MVSVLRSPDSYQSNRMQLNLRKVSQDASMSQMDGAISEYDPN